MITKTVTFTSDSQLLAELGERLIATPQIALSELVKNAYDADATKVHVWLSDDGKTLNVKDDGQGMSEEDFRTAWMRIASSHKLEQEVSRRYHRPLTGSKGVGRFAVRLLGEHLLLETATSEDSALRAKFPWGEFASGTKIELKPIKYWTDVRDLWTGIPNLGPGNGTLLRISRLRDAWSHSMLASVSGYVLQLQTPHFVNLSETKGPAHTRDPGFKIYFSPPGMEQELHDPTQEIVARAAITLRMQLRKQKLTLKYSFRSERDPVTYSYAISGPNLVGRLDADIRFLPKRPGAFAGLESHDGREAAGWVRQNSGIRVFDRGFRIPPYGLPNDDWVRLAMDVAARRRTWDSPITDAILPAPPDKAPTESLHPALHLPGNHQVIGYVALLTHSIGGKPDDLKSAFLQPSMDRQGFVQNAGFRQLYDIVRGGMEILAFLDLDEELRRRKEQRQKAVDELHGQIDEALQEVAANPDIPSDVRKSITKQLRSVQGERSASRGR